MGDIIGSGVLGQARRRVIEPKAGDPLSARILGDAAVTLNKMLARGRTPFGIPGDRQFTVSMLARVEEVKGDYLVCVRAQIKDSPGSDPEVETFGEKFSVLKPYLLQRTPFEDKSRGDFSYTYQSDTERTSDDDGDEEEQIIVPAYEEEEDLIVVQTAPVGLGALLDEDDLEIVWIDSNNDGRTWGKKA